MSAMPKGKNPFWNIVWTAVFKNNPQTIPCTVKGVIESRQDAQSFCTAILEAEKGRKGPQRVDFEDKNVVAN